MKKAIRSFTAVILILCTTWICSGATAINPCWNYVTIVGGHIDIPSSILGIAEVRGHGSASTVGVDNVVCTVYLEQMKDRKWVTVNSWKSAARARSAQVSTKKYAVAHGYSYRVRVTLAAYKGSKLLETGEFTESYVYFN